MHKRQNIDPSAVDGDVEDLKQKHKAMNTLTEGKMKQTKQKTITNGGL